MSVVIRGKEKFIIDRTLITITHKNINRNKIENGLNEFIINLKKIGVDFFEIDERTFNYVGSLIISEALIFRIDEASQLEFCRKNGIGLIIIKEENLELIETCNTNNNYNFEIILEIDISLYKSGLVKNINNLIDVNKLFSVRVKGEDNWLFNDYITTNFKAKINMYASNKFSMATSIGFQAIIKEYDYVTTSFCGKDGVDGTTALEELLVAIKVILGGQVNGDISILSKMRLQYEKITYCKLPNNKPVIGIGVFKYESGVHVAGIEKNPTTYEPFKPELVGLERKLALGKHSGKNSITCKLKELGIDNKFSVCDIIRILEKVKNISISNKVELSDKDFIDICSTIERIHYV